MACKNKREPVVEEITLRVRTALSQMETIWEEIGVSEEGRLAYLSQVSEYINDLLQDMVSETESKKETILNNVKSFLDEIAVLSKELRTDVAISGYEHLPLKEIEVVLSTDLKKLQSCKEQRMTQLKEFLNKERALCKALGVQPINIEEKVPSEEELNSFKLYLEKQESEKNRLESIFKETRRAIVKMMDDLGKTPTTSFENLVCKDSENFVLNSNNMTKLREFRDQLKQQVDSAKEYVEDIKQQLLGLWKYLDEPKHVYESFLNSYVGYSLATVNALTAELDRCKEKRRENVAKYVSQVRSELVKLWDLCKFSEEQRRRFVHFHSHTYTDDLLTLHELELKRMQDFYEASKPIFDCLQERENLWSKMRELRQRATNPDRFYNRGGQLLMEEKERKKIQKKLPKIEDDLRALINDYETVHGEVFTINGMSVNELIQESWENFNEEKETIKKARKEAKDKSVKKTTLSASKKPALSSSKKPQVSLISRRNISTFNPSKRKLLFSPSPNTSNSKRRNVTVTASRIKRSGKFLRTPIDKPKSSNKTGKKDTSQKENSVSDTTYNHFKEHLEDRGELRSSLLPSRLLATASTSVKTPVRTPVKPLRKNLTPMLTTPKLSESRLQKSPRTPRTGQSSRLAPVSTPLPIIF
ncbi:protein regulator of cytokinesis 1-like [Ceratina calcarata]|uniref:Protein regulator of cytokinesis 1-like n=1 Tax=Ceratina calcarata TaxID=156304 RepID=A0AAJ7JAN3_9HYME|nr:protein regulator of cytokinesis 1-like [Ceratina calcarata]